MRAADEGTRPGWPERLYGVYALAVFLLLVPIAWMAVLLPDLCRRRRAIRAIARLMLRLARLPVDVEGAAHLVQERPCILVANHTSNLDVIALIAVIPIDIRFVAKSEFRANPLTRTLMRGVGSIFVERRKRRQGPGSTRRILEAVRQGLSVLVFPEGTFRPGAGLWPFRMGAFVVATNTATPVVPVAIHGARQILPAKHLLPRPGRIRIIVAEPIHPAGIDWGSAQKLRDAVYLAVLERCGEPPAIEAA